MIGAPYTTDTLYAGLQLVMPNETAPAHRHTAFAMRFIIEGNGGFTAIHGKRIRMNRGDVILTPTWNWHDHGKDDAGPMIWLDGLDLPNFVHFPVHFVEHYQKPRYPATDIDGDDSPLVFPWEVMKAALDSELGTSATKRYLKEDTSEGMSIMSYGLINLKVTLTSPTVSKVIGAQAERVNAGTSTKLQRETSSCVYHVVCGDGYTTISNKTFTLKQGDTFCIPAWHPYQHTAGTSTLYLYRFDDQPMLKALGFYRTEDTELEKLAEH